MFQEAMSTEQDGPVWRGVKTLNQIGNATADPGATELRLAIVYTDSGNNSGFDLLYLLRRDFASYKCVKAAPSELWTSYHPI